VSATISCSAILELENINSPPIKIRVTNKHDAPIAITLAPIRKFEVVGAIPWRPKPTSKNGDAINVAPKGGFLSMHRTNNLKKVARLPSDRPILNPRISLPGDPAKNDSVVMSIINGSQLIKRVAKPKLDFRFFSSVFMVFNKFSPSEEYRIQKRNKRMPM